MLSVSLFGKAGMQYKLLMDAITSIQQNGQACAACQEAEENLSPGMGRIGLAW